MQLKISCNMNDYFVQILYDEQTHSTLFHTFSVPKFKNVAVICTYNNYHNNVECFRPVYGIFKNSLRFIEIRSIGMPTFTNQKYI